jgi:threonine/homoserine/homoserine lactone efflux protein
MSGIALLVFTACLLGALLPGVGFAIALARGTRTHRRDRTHERAMTKF